MDDFALNVLDKGMRKGEALKPCLEGSHADIPEKQTRETPRIIALNTAPGDLYAMPPARTFETAEL